jgi:hypothetical protein
MQTTTYTTELVNHGDRINWRTKPLPGGRLKDSTRQEFIGTQPYIHQLAMVASGRRAAQLSLATHNADYEVSHLCSENKCFNPEHVVVESRHLNGLRRTCQCHRIVDVLGNIVNPCRHGDVEHQVKCILPMRNSCLGVGTLSRQLLRNPAASIHQARTGDATQDALQSSNITPLRRSTVYWVRVHVPAAAAAIRARALSPSRVLMFLVAVKSS